VIIVMRKVIVVLLVLPMLMLKATLQELKPIIVTPKVSALELQALKRTLKAGIL
jgi:hypothetical protein